MRVIRTELYFDPEVLLGAATENPGVSVCWFGTGDGAKIELQDLVEDMRGSSELRVAFYSYVSDADENLLRRFISTSLVGIGSVFEWAQRRGPRPIINQSAVDAVLNADIVIEQSPPTVETLKALLKLSPSVAIGTYVGLLAAGDSQLLLFATVPAGIIVVGSAIGVSKAMESGLNQGISKAIKRVLK